MCLISDGRAIVRSPRRGVRPTSSRLVNSPPPGGLLDLAAPRLSAYRCAVSRSREASTTRIHHRGPRWSPRRCARGSRASPKRPGRRAPNSRRTGGSRPDPAAMPVGRGHQPDRQRQNVVESASSRISQVSSIFSAARRRFCYKNHEVVAYMERRIWHTRWVNRNRGAFGSFLTVD